MPKQNKKQKKQSKHDKQVREAYDFIMTIDGVQQPYTVSNVKHSNTLFEESISGWQPPALAPITIDSITVLVSLRQMHENGTCFIETALEVAQELDAALCEFYTLTTVNVYLTHDETLDQVNVTISGGDLHTRAQAHDIVLLNIDRMMQDVGKRLQVTAWEDTLDHVTVT